MMRSRRLGACGLRATGRRVVAHIGGPGPLFAHEFLLNGLRVLRWHIVASERGLGDRPALRGGGCVPLTVACCFKVQVESDFDKGRRGSRGPCMAGVHITRCTCWAWKFCITCASYAPKSVT
jgi:hypothetical protein